MTEAKKGVPNPTELQQDLQKLFEVFPRTSEADPSGLSRAVSAFRLGQSELPRRIGQIATDLISQSVICDPLQALIIIDIEHKSEHPLFALGTEDPLFYQLRLNRQGEGGIFDTRNKKDISRDLLRYYARKILAVQRFVDDTVRDVSGKDLKWEKTERAKLFGQARQQFIEEFGEEP